MSPRSQNRGSLIHLTRRYAQSCPRHFRIAVAGTMESVIPE